MLRKIVGVVLIVYAAIALLGAAFVVLAMLWSVFSGAVAAISVTVSLRGILIGAVIGFFAVRYLRDRNTDMVQNG